MIEPKRRRDWIGRKVRLTQTLRNGKAIFPAGIICRVTGVYHGFRLEYIKACSRCRLQHIHGISRVPYDTVELIQGESEIVEP